MNFQKLYQQALNALNKDLDTTLNRDLWNTPLAGLGVAAAPGGELGSLVGTPVVPDPFAPLNTLWLMGGSSPGTGAITGVTPDLTGGTGLSGLYGAAGASIGYWPPNTTSSVSTGLAGYQQSITIQMAGQARAEMKERVLPKGDVAGPIIAYRHWTLQGTDTLVSGTGTVWPHGQPLKAYCSTGYAQINDPAHHKSPFAGCGCGVYAFKQQHLADFEGYRTGYFGEIALWGKVIETAKGFRAEYAYPKRLILQIPMAGFPLPKKVQKVFEGLADAYGIPIYVGKELPPVRPDP